jgi:hypothetical protein
MSANLRSVAAPSPVPGDTFVDHVHDNLARRRPRLYEMCPDAIELGAAILVALHRGLAGRQEAVRGDRAGSIFRREIRGEHSLGVEDLARLALEVPTAVKAPVAILAEAVGLTVQPREPRHAEVVSEALALMRQTVDAGTSAIKAVADGNITDNEDAEVRSMIASIRAHLVGLEVALAMRRRGQR